MSEIVKNNSGKSEIDWGGVEELADKFEEGRELEEDEELAGKVAQLREWIDIEGIAAEQDPEGLVEVEREEAEIDGRIESYHKELAEENGKQEYYKNQAGEIDVEIGNAENNLSRFDRDSSRSKFKGIKKILGIGAKKRAKLQGKLDTLEAEAEEAKRGRDDSRTRANVLEEEIKKMGELRPKQEFLEKFETPLTPEEKKEGLDFDALAELSTEEYLKLWRRLNPFYLTHATRQGVRDHVWAYHNHGRGEMNNGLVEILADNKKLRTPSEVLDGLSREINEETVAVALDKMLNQEKVLRKFDIEEMRGRGIGDGEIVDKIVEALPVNSSLGEADAWGDARSVHFGQNVVLDDFYGGETGNEVFFVFPTDVLASQCRLNDNGPDKGLVTALIKEDKPRNNIFVWPKEKDITVDAGLTFLPKSTLVDSETGSKYATKVIELDGREIRVPEEAGDTGLVWKMAENTVPAEEYWEKYFREHPEQRPAHVIYYDGNPSEAVKNVLKEAGVLEDAEKPVWQGGRYLDDVDYKEITGRSDTSEKDGVWLGFEENRVAGTGDSDVALKEEQTKFNQIARRLIAERYGLEV